MINVKRMKAALIIGPLVLLAIGLSIGYALAHGDAQWIMDEDRYRDKNNQHCCGPRDCERADAANFIETRDGIKIASTGQLLSKAEKGLYTSKDNDWWWCRWGGEVKCVFKPSAGA